MSVFEWDCSRYAIAREGAFQRAVVGVIRSSNFEFALTLHDPEVISLMNRFQRGFCLEVSEVRG